MTARTHTLRRMQAIHLHSTERVLHQVCDQHNETKKTHHTKRKWPSSSTFYYIRICLNTYIVESLVRRIVDVHVCMAMCPRYGATRANGTGRCTGGSQHEWHEWLQSMKLHIFIQGACVRGFWRFSSNWRLLHTHIGIGSRGRFSSRSADRQCIGVDKTRNLCFSETETSLEKFMISQDAALRNRSAIPLNTARRHTTIAPVRPESMCWLTRHSARFK